MESREWKIGHTINYRWEWVSGDDIKVREGKRRQVVMMQKMMVFVWFSNDWNVFIHKMKSHWRHWSAGRGSLIFSTEGARDKTVSGTSVKTLVPWSEFLIGRHDWEKMKAKLFWLQKVSKNQQIFMADKKISTRLFPSSFAFDRPSVEWKSQ